MLTDLLLEVVFKVGLMAVAFLIVFVPITVLTWIVTEWRKWRDRSGK